MAFTSDFADCPFEIGNTPLSAFRVTLNGVTHDLFLKEERCNPFGSVKDRVAWYVLSKTLEQTGPAKAVVDASSGNYGYALARICQQMGIGCTIVSSPSISAYNAAGIEDAGATLLIADALPGESANAARMRVAGEVAARDGAVFLDQYASFLNPASHETWTAPEVFADGPFDACFVTSSSGGTARGFSDYLKAHPEKAALWLVEPAGSCAFLAAEPEAEKLCIPGYGSGRRSTFSEIDPAPNMLRVEDPAVLATFSQLQSRGLAKIGLSSAGVVLGAISWLSRQDQPRRAVCICADGDERYLDEIESRYIPSVGRPAYDAACVRLSPVIGAIERMSPALAGA